MFTGPTEKLFLLLFSITLLIEVRRLNKVKVKVKLRRCCERLLAVFLTYRTHPPQYVTQIKNATLFRFSYDLTYSLTLITINCPQKRIFFNKTLLKVDIICKRRLCRVIGTWSENNNYSFFDQN